MLLVSVATLFGIGGAHLVSAQTTQRSVDEELIPLHQVEPVYPAGFVFGKVKKIDVGASNHEKNSILYCFSSLKCSYRVYIQCPDTYF